MKSDNEQNIGHIKEYEFSDFSNAFKLLLLFDSTSVLSCATNGTFVFISECLSGPL